MTLHRFTKIDTDGSGTLDRDEVRLALKRMGKDMAADEFDAAFKAMDLDEGGEVEFDEFEQWWGEQDGSAQGRLKAGFGTMIKSINLGGLGGLGLGGPGGFKLKKVEKVNDRSGVNVRPTLPLHRPLTISKSVRA